VKSRFFILFAVLVFSVKSFAQSGTPLSQFSNNPLIYNPGYTELSDALSMNLSVHKSWLQIPRSPQTINFNGLLPVGFDQKHRLGWVLQNDTWGPIAENNIYANYAYAVNLGKNGVLNFGLQAGVLLHTVDWEKIDHVISWSDPTMEEGRRHSTKFDVNVGAYYVAPTWFFGLSAMHLTNPKRDKIRINEKEYFSQMGTQFFLTTGGNIWMDDDLEFCPEVLVRYAHTTPISVNAGVHLQYMKRHRLGINYMTGQHGISFSFRTQIAKQFRIGYSYDIFMGAIGPFQRGSHEISVNYKIGGFSKFV
jgi:type IX secretion system PorP/SprF family membrane protein